jgi:hypothetical protein
MGFNSGFKGLIQIDKKPKFGMYDLDEATREVQRKF